MSNQTYQTFFELNRNNQQTLYLDEVENAIDSLETAVQFISRSDSLKWKWLAIALHHSLYMFCIAAIVGGNYDNVLSKGRDDDDPHYCRFNENQPWNKSRKQYRPNSPGYKIVWESTDEDPERKSSESAKSTPHRPTLISFWTALARVQDNFFWMRRLVHTQAVSLSEDEWHSIEWLTSQIRNNFVHFIPRAYAVWINDVKKACIDIIRVIEFLALHSHAVLLIEHDQDEPRIKNAIAALRSAIQT